MATLHYYVDTASTSGGNGTTTALTGANCAYATLSAAIAALAQNLVTAGNSIVVHCDASTGTGDTAVVNFGTWTTDSTHYLTVQVDTSRRHSGIWNSSKYSIGSYNALNLPPSYTRFIGLQVHNNGSDDLGVTLFRLDGSRQGVQIHSCIGRFTDKNYTYGRNYHVDCGVDGTGDPTIITNCLFYGGIGTHGATDSVGILAINCNVVAYNCTLIGAGAAYSAKAIQDGYGRVKSVNNLVKGWAAFDNPHATGTDYNATDLAAASGSSGATHDRVSQAFTFTAPTASPPDYSLAGTDTSAKGQGTDLSGDSTYPFSVDIVGASRATPWDVGAFAVVAVTTTSATATGAFTFGGSATATQQETATATGAFTFGGSATAVQGSSGLFATGAISFGGAATATQGGINATATGAFAFSGSATATTVVVRLDIGINFRATSGYVTDGANETYCLDDLYPTMRAGQTFGWVTGGGAVSTRDRSASVDRRLAGMNSVPNAFGQPADFRFDVPAAGAYTIHLGLSNNGYAALEYVEIRDGAGLLATVANGTPLSWPPEALDATGASYGLSDWPTSEVGVNVVLSTPYVVIRNGSATALGTSYDSVISYIRVVAAGSAPAGTNATATGTIVFAGSASATQGGLNASAAGALVFTGSASATSSISATASGAVAFAGTATAGQQERAVTTGTIAFSGAASASVAGVASALGTIAFGGAAAAHVASGGAAASGAITFVGTATATQGSLHATASGALAFAGAATAGQQETASAAGSIVIVGSAIGTQQESATVNPGVITFGGYATATTAGGAHATGVVAFAGSATAVSAVAGLAAGALSLSGHATVAVAVVAAATGQLGLAGSASATVVDTANASGPIAFSGYATANQRNNATASGVLAFGGTATAHPQGTGTGIASGTIVFAGGATATQSGPLALAAGTIVVGGAATAGVVVTAATLPGTLHFAGSGSAVAQDTGAIHGAIVFAGYGSAAVTLTVAAASTITFGGHGAARTNAELILFGAWLTIEMQYLGAFSVEHQYDGTFSVEQEYDGAFIIGGGGTP